MMLGDAPGVAPMDRAGLEALAGPGYPDMNPEEADDVGAE